MAPAACQQKTPCLPCPGLGKAELGVAATQFTAFNKGTPIANPRQKHILSPTQQHAPSWSTPHLPCIS